MGDLPHEPQGLYDDEPWVSFTVLRSEMLHEADQEMLGAHPHTLAFIDRVMARLERLRPDG